MLLVLLCLEDVTTLFLRVWKSILAVWFPITLYEKRAWKYLNPSYRGRKKKPSRYNVTKTKTNNELNVSCKGDYGIKFIVNVFQVLHWHSQVNGFVWTVWNSNSSGLLKKIAQTCIIWGAFDTVIIWQFLLLNLPNVLNNDPQSHIRYTLLLQSWGYWLTHAHK